MYHGSPQQSARQCVTGGLQPSSSSVQQRAHFLFGNVPQHTSPAAGHGSGAKLHPLPTPTGCWTVPTGSVSSSASPPQAPTIEAPMSHAAAPAQPILEAVLPPPRVRAQQQTGDYVSRTNGSPARNALGVFTSRSARAAEQIERALEAIARRRGGVGAERRCATSTPLRSVRRKAARKNSPAIARPGGVACARRAESPDARLRSRARWASR
jgi:hypothetical protein